MSTLCTSKLERLFVSTISIVIYKIYVVSVLKLHLTMIYKNIYIYMYTWNMSKVSKIYFSMILEFVTVNRNIKGEIGLYARFHDKTMLMRKVKLCSRNTLSADKLHLSSCYSATRHCTRLVGFMTSGALSSDDFIWNLDRLWGIILRCNAL